MDPQQHQELHRTYSDLHDSLADNSQAKQSLKTLVRKQGESLQRLRQHLTAAKQAGANVDLSGFEAELTDLGTHQALLDTIDGPKKSPQELPAGLNHPNWPYETVTQGDLGATSRGSAAASREQLAGATGAAAEENETDETGAGGNFEVDSEGRKKRKSH